MQNKPKINLYDVSVSKNTNRILTPKKSITNIKIVLFSLLAFITLLSVGQSVFLINSKTSFADSSTISSRISVSSRSTVNK